MLLACRRAIVPTCIAVGLGCAASRVPHALRGYNVLVEEKDEQSVELARAMREQGIKVRPRVRGGSGPTAALIYFTFSDPGPGQPLWFHLRLADTRSGEIVAVGPGRREKGETIPMELKVGDRVIYGKYSGTQVELNDEEIILIKEADVIAKLA